MYITPTGNLRIVFTGPLRLKQPRLGDWAPIDKDTLKAVIDVYARQGAFSVRAPADDRHALEIFDVPGTSESPYPLELIAALRLPTESARIAMQPILNSFVGEDSPFQNAVIAAAILRIFGNGYAAVVITVELGIRPNVEHQRYIDYLIDRLKFTDKHAEGMREQAKPAIGGLIRPICEALVRHCGDEADFDGEIRFLSVFYVMSADWDPYGHEELELDPRLRTILQPEAQENLINQSNSRNELVIFTSAFHVYVRNSRSISDLRPRTIALVSFLSLMNILWDQLNFVRGEMISKLKLKPWIWERTDLDDQLEILYRQITVSSVTWRRDYSSFRDEIDRRWRMSEIKGYCIALIAELEARSARKRRAIFDFVIAVLALASLVSIVADGFQLWDRQDDRVPGSAKRSSAMQRP